MGSITIDDILQANQLAPSSATSWADFLLGLEKNIEYLNSSVAAPLTSAWSGTAQQLATGRVNASKDGLLTSASQITAVQGIVEDFNDKLNQWASSLESLTSQASSAGLNVAQDGTVTITIPFSEQQAYRSSDPTGWAKLLSTRESIQSQIQMILQAAEQADAQAAADLQQQMPSRGGEGVTTTVWFSQDSSLWQIAQQVYGNGSEWPVIWNANKDMLVAKYHSTGPNDIPAGVQLVVPAISDGKPAAAPAAPPHSRITPSQAYNFAIASGVSPGSVTGTGQT